jgi:hypothetical protein
MDTPIWVFNGKSSIVLGLLLSAKKKNTAPVIINTIVIDNTILLTKENFLTESLETRSTTTQKLKDPRIINHPIMLKTTKSSLNACKPSE